VTKEELRAELERQAERYKDVYGGEVTTYAAQPDPERKPWRKRASVLDQAFARKSRRSKRNCAATTTEADRCQCAITQEGSEASRVSKNL